MKVSVIDTAASILSGIKINRVSDREAKSALLKDYLAVRRVAKKADDDKNEIITKFQDDWRDEIKAVRSFREKGKPVIGHLDYLEAERDANRAVQDIFSVDVDIDLSAVKLDAIADFSEDVTLEQVAFLVEVGILEE